MNHIFFSKEFFEFFEDYRKIVLSNFLIKSDADLLRECGFLRNDTVRLSLEF